MSADDAEPVGPEAPKKSGRGLCLWLVLAVLLVGGCSFGGALAVVFQYSLRRSLASFDTTLTYTVADPSARDEVRTVLQRRLRSVGILAKVERASGPDQLDVKLQREDVERAKPLLARPGGALRFLFVVEEEHLAPMARDEEIGRIRRAKDAGTYDRASARYDLLPQSDGNGELLLEPTGLKAGDFQRFERALDDKGRAAVGFVMSVKGRKKLYRVTSDNIGRRLAIVLGGEVRTAPVIRSPIGKRGIIEGGAEGWTDAELSALLATLNAGELPCAVELTLEATVR